MIHHKIKPHLNTSNMYAQLQILRDNVAMIKNYQQTEEYRTLFYPLKRDIQNALARQEFLKKELQIKIKKSEQTSFPFGGC